MSENPRYFYLFLMAIGSGFTAGAMSIGLNPELGWWVLDVDPSADGYAGIVLPPAIIALVGLASLGVGVAGLVSVSSGKR